MGSHELTAIWRHGRKSALYGKSIDDNPYQSGERKLAWVQGFKAGLEMKRNPHRLTKEEEDGDDIS